MFRNFFYAVSFFFFVAATSVVASESAAPDRPVMIGPDLEFGFDMGIEDNCDRHDWLSSSQVAHDVSYLGGCPWAAVFVTVGTPGSGEFMDLSNFTAVSVDIKGAAGSSFWVGMKEYDREGAGPRQRMVLRSDEWDNYTINIGNFPNLRAHSVHSVFELIFGRDAVALQFRNITLIHSDAKNGR